MNHLPELVVLSVNPASYWNGLLRLLANTLKFNVCPDWNVIGFAPLIASACVSWIVKILAV